MVTSGVAKYSFKGKVKVTLTTYTAGGFNNFGEPTTATFTTPVEALLHKVVVTLTCRAPTLDVDGDGVFADDDCPKRGRASLQQRLSGAGTESHFEGNLNLADGQGIVVSCPSGLWPDWANMVLNVNRAVRHSPVDSEGTRIIAANGNSPYGIWFLNEHEDDDRNPLAVTGTYSIRLHRATTRCRCGWHAGRYGQLPRSLQLWSARPGWRRNRQ